MRKNTCIYRRTAMLLGEATFMLGASALPAAAQTMRLDRQAGTCEELNTRVASLGVTDEEA